MNVLVILGGTSAEREVSLKSGDNVIKALRAAGHTVKTYDPKIYGDLKAHTLSTDVVFPILHGKGGEDGELQKQLEQHNIPFVGSSSAVSAACFDKYQTQQQLSDVLFPKTEIVKFNDLSQSSLRDNPYVLKPLDEGSSIDTFIVKDYRNFDINSIKEVFSRHSNMMLQELIDGIELTVPVLIDKALPVIEIVPPKGKDFDYENKYNGATQELCPPININQANQIRAQKIALNVHKTMGCRGFSRTDFILTDDEELYALEINTLPGMTKESLFPKSAKEAGISIEQLVDTLVKDAIKPTL